MTAPAVAARALVASLATGAALGAIYGFLRPLRPRLTAVADLVFIVTALWSWLYLTFGICSGDSRPGCILAILAGMIIWEATGGRLLRPVFALFWRGIGWPLGKIGNFFQKFYNYMLAIRKK